MMRSAFGIQNPTKMMASDVLTEIQKLVPMEVSSFDVWAYLVPLQVWKDFTEFEWSKEKKYLADIWDCDNYAMAYASHASEILDITGFRVWGTVYDKDTNVKVGYHYWNACFTSDKELYFIEPQTGGMVKAGNGVIIDKWKYYPIKIYLH